MSVSHFLKTGLICLLLTLTACTPPGVRVRRGDTLYSLSQKYDVPLEAIMAENNLNSATISIGQYLKFPSHSIHKVRAGDTLYSLAKKYDLSVETIAHDNNLKKPYTLKVGDRLKISSWYSWTDEEESPRSATAKTVKGKKTASRQSAQNAAQTAGKQAAGSQKASSKKAAKTAYRAPKNVQIPKSQSKKKFAWPIKGKIIADYGAVKGTTRNDGINIAGKVGSAIKAAEGGTVAYAGDELRGYGNLVLLKHKDGWITAYAHNDKLLVKKGDVVQKGQTIAKMGKSGGVSSPQLHFEVRYRTKVVNPKSYLTK